MGIEQLVGWMNSSGGYEREAYECLLALIQTREPEYVIALQEYMKS